VNLLSRAWSGLKSLLGGGKAAKPEAKDDGSLRWRMALAGVLPGWWASNHLNEATRVEGWQFVAIRTLSRMGSQAELSVHEVGSRSEKFRRTRRALRLAKLLGDKKSVRRWKSRLKKLRVKTAPTAQGVRNDRVPVRSGHPLLRLMQRVNPEWSLATFLFAAIQQWAATGSCYVWCYRDDLGTPRELYVLPTGLLTQRAPSAKFPRGSYYLTPLSTFGLANPGSEWEQGTLGAALMAGREIDFRDVKPVRWPHPLNLSDGLSPLSAIKLWVDCANEMDRSSFYGLLNTGRPGMVISQKQDGPDPDQADLIRFEEWLRSESAGSSNTGRHMWLPKGLEAQPRYPGPAELDFPNSRPAYRDMNLAAHGVSQIACGIMEAGSLAAYRAALKQTTDLAVQPALNLLAGELTELLGSEFDGPRCEIGLHAPSVNDPAELESRLKTDIMAGNAVTVDEYRALRGLPPLGGDLGKAFVGQRTTVRLEDKDPEKPGIQGDGRAPDGGRRDPDDSDSGKCHTNGHSRNGLWDSRVRF